MPCGGLPGGAVAETSTQESKHHTWRAGELRFSKLAIPDELSSEVLGPELRVGFTLIGSVHTVTLHTD